MIFGLSTGTLHRFDQALDLKLLSMLKYGANAVEIVFILPEVLENFKPTKTILQVLDKFEYVSMHAPFIMHSKFESKTPFQRMVYSSDVNTKKLFEKLEKISSLFRSKSVVFHPNTVKDMALLAEYDMNASIENMDTNKDEGTDSEYFTQIRNLFDFSYVLDLHHVFTHDSSMKSTNSYLKAMGEKLQHLHVSGQSGKEGHLPINESDNRDLIMNYVRSIKKPIILEGTISGKDMELGINAEFEFLKSALS